MYTILLIITVIATPSPTPDAMRMGYIYTFEVCEPDQKQSLYITTSSDVYESALDPELTQLHGHVVHGARGQVATCGTVSHS